ncbi:DUF4834 family protein [Sphingobacterium hungaricum]|uniref:DUF4834 domain-containing protein n=1 Tax=Sphingobacterium hungaricum TaxID=2082723 RepID=A0A928UU81_9SPHI|nr:DUF4834 family protein [Sphingobacterium hungaricum]MBE8713320.1 DUF4834 domain-containing protein [Sphingobacterium hungaricum]
MNSFLYFIICAVAFYYIFKFAMRLIMPFAMRKMAEKLMQKAQQSQSGQQSYQYTNSNPFDQFKTQQQKPDGKIHVDYVPPKEDERKGTATAGEFIDFEEIK